MPPKKSAPATSAGEPSDANVSAKYKKHELRDHIYELPDTYIGSVESVALDTFVYDDEQSAMVKKTITFVPGLYKIFDEIIVNALDHCVRLKTEIAKGETDDVRPVKSIRISIDKESGQIEVYNDGDGIDITVHDTHNVYVPQLIFGELLTSTNYDKDTEKLWSGRNGYGAKATNIFSTEFIIETVDHRRKKIYTQRFFENMKKHDKPIVKACAKVPYTKVTFTPDYARFGMSGMTEDIYQLFKKRAYDACATTDNSVSIYFNDTKLEIKSFERYVDLYIGGKAATKSKAGADDSSETASVAGSEASGRLTGAGTKLPRAFEIVSDRWEIAATYSPQGCFEQVSFVNGIATIRGGKHIDAVVAQITKKLSEKTKKDIKPQHIKDNLMLFVKCLIVNPSFDTQTKEQLTTPVAKFGSKFELSDKFIAALVKTGLVDRAMRLTEFHDKKQMSKTDGKKTSRVLIPNLDDANWAGTKKSSECTLILTEGLSAKTMAVSGLSVVGRDKYGIFPLRGKILNVQGAQPKQIADNEEISHLKKILGLAQGRQYKDASELRYGSIMIMTDADHDGSHIKGLLFNLFRSLWPSLYQLDGFLTSMLTPIVKATRGAECVTFYNLHDFDKWREALTQAASGSRGGGGNAGWNFRYLKGLGTSSEAEAKEYFRDMKKLVYKYEGDTSDEGLDLAFNKKRADDRKSWLMQYKREEVLDVSHPERPITYEEFIDKELIHFSNRDLERSINHLCDGLKESTRKIMFACFKRKLYGKTIKVAQLAAYVAEVSAYHHGETSLQQAIIGMAQQYIGSNNINLLVPSGQFGTRLHGGKDASSPRYIFTAISPLAKLIFREEDLPVLNYLNDDGMSIEPEYYIPIIPLVLVNGGIGIGTGFSTNVPNHNPDDIITACENIAKHGNTDVTIQPPMPWYLGFKGTISLPKPGSYQSKGIWTWIDDTTIEISELPVGTWTEDYKSYIEALIAGNSPVLKDYEYHCTTKNVKFILKLYPGTRNVVEATFENDFNMTNGRMSVNNIHLFGENGAICKYSDTTHVIKEWAKVRLTKYTERKAHQIKTMEHDYMILSARVRFIQEIIAKTLKVMNVKMVDLEKQLSEKGYPVDVKPDIAKTDDANEGEGDGDDSEVVPIKTNSGYNYLTRMPIHQLTAERKAALEKQADDLQMKIDALREKTVQAIWLEELAELRTAWTAFRKDIEEEYSTSRIQKPSQSKPKASGRGKKA
jgi:DNA topoisomerase-2